MDKNKDYSLWLFLDLEKYGDGKAARVMEKAIRRTPEFKGSNGKRIYFEFKDQKDKANFILTVGMELKRQGYRWVFVKEEDSNTPNFNTPNHVKFNGYTNRFRRNRSQS